MKRMSQPLQIFRQSRAGPRSARDQVTNASTEDPREFHRQPRRSGLAGDADTDRGCQRRPLDRMSPKLPAIDFQRNAGVCQHRRAKPAPNHGFLKWHAVNFQNQVQPDVVLHSGPFQQSSIAMRQTRQDQRYFAQFFKSNDGPAKIKTRGSNENHSFMQDRNRVDSFQWQRIVQHRETYAPIEQPLLERRTYAFAEEKSLRAATSSETSERSLAQSEGPKWGQYPRSRGL